MIMTQREIFLIRSTFEIMKMNSASVAESFYNKLFHIAPETKALFKNDIEEQGAKLMHMIAIAVANIDNLDTLTTPLKELGKRHEQYGVQQTHYALVGEVLLWSLENELKEKFTNETRVAWSNLYNNISKAMMLN